MLHGYAVFKNSSWEFLSEAYAIRHEVRYEATHWTPAQFVQIARKIGDFTPYARFSYFNAAASNPVYSYIGVSGLHYGPSVGIRYDFSTFVALKAQFDHLISTGSKDIEQMTLQAAFTF